MHNEFKDSTFLKKEWSLAYIITHKRTKKLKLVLELKMYYIKVVLGLEKLTNIVDSPATDYFKLINLSLFREGPFFVLLLSRWWKETSCSTHLDIHRCKSTHSCRVICLPLIHHALYCNKKKSIVMQNSLSDSEKSSSVKDEDMTLWEEKTNVSKLAPSTVLPCGDSRHHYQFSQAASTRL